MKNFTLKSLVLAFILCFSLSHAQEKNNASQKLFNQDLTPDNVKSLQETGFIRCGSTEYEAYLQETYPNRASKEEFENWLSPKIQEFNSQRVAEPNILQTIPVIFHIITDGFGSENLSQAAVQAQIDQLNIDYRNLAGSPFGVAADTEVEFCLAQQDPAGAQLTEIGINRVTAYGDSNFLNTYVNSTIKPGTQWDPTKYMNVWVVGALTNGTFDLLGYAQFPDSSGLPGLNASGGAANTDGVVIIASSVGSVANPNPNGGIYAAGRTLTHEAGHWLGLRHIWGDTSACTNDDYCADTPDATTSNGGCPTIDHCPVDGLGNDMVENYMDYTNDTCMNTLTADQKTRILTVLANSPRRVELVTSNVCQPGLTYDLDGSINIDNLNLVLCGNSFTPDVEITNNGNDNLTSGTIEYYLDSDTPTSAPWTGNLAIGESEIVTLPLIMIPPGSHTFTVELTSPNGGTDEQTSNNMDTSSAFSAYFDTTQIHLSLLTDDYAEETTWQFKNSSNTVLYSGSYTQTTDDNTTFMYDFDVVVGECYTFTINDAASDGICCNYGVGSYELTTDDLTVIFTGGEFNAQENITMGVNTLGVNDYFLNNALTIYPNPVNDKLTIKLSNNNLPDGYKIYNMLGQTISESSISNLSDLEINTSSLSNGMYFVKVSKDNSIVTLPFIKN